MGHQGKVNDITSDRRGLLWRTRGRWKGLIEPYLTVKIHRDLCLSCLEKPGEVSQYILLKNTEDICGFCDSAEFPRPILCSVLRKDTEVTTGKIIGYTHKFPLSFINMGKTQELTSQRRQHVVNLYRLGKKSKIKSF